MRKLSIIGMPMDLGQMRRGVDMGPSAIRYAGINERLKPLFSNMYSWNIATSSTMPVIPILGSIKERQSRLLALTR